MAIKLVLFDIGGVLLDDIFPYLKNCKLFEKYDIAPEKFNAARKRYWTDHLLGRMDIEEFFTKIFHDLQLPDKEIPVIIKRSYLYLKLVEGTMDLVKQLKMKKIKLGILSNNTKEWSTYSVEKYRLDKYFDVMFFSCDLGMAKPFPEIYRHVLSQTKLKPEEILFIDNDDRNMPAAVELGIKTLIFKDAEQLKKDLVAMRLI